MSFRGGASRQGSVEASMREAEVIKPIPSEVERRADWVLDLGPEGGDKGGEVVAQGTPEQVAEEPRSYTGGYLRELLANSVRAEMPPAPARKRKPNAAPAQEREAAE